jgi:hypothetical protein
MTTQFLGIEAIETLRASNPAYRLREVDQTAPAGMWSVDAQGADLRFQAATAADWSAYTTVVTLASTPAVTIHGTLTVSGTIVFAGDVRLDDDIVVLFGDDSDFYMGYSATDDALEIGTGATIASGVALSVDTSGNVAVDGDLEIGDDLAHFDASGGNIGLGSASTETIFLNSNPTYSATANGTTRLYGFGGTITSFNNSAAHGVVVNPVISTYTSGTHALINSLHVSAANITVNGSAGITEANSVYIVGAPTEAVNNSAFRISDQTTVYANAATDVHYAYFGIQTLTAASAFTLTNVSTVYIAGAPDVSDADITATNGPYALWVDAGTSRFDGGASFGGDINLNDSDLLNVGASGNDWDATSLRTGAIVGTTIDATTDFTVGSLVITDDAMSVGGSQVWQVSPAPLAGGNLAIYNLNIPAGDYQGSTSAHVYNFNEATLNNTGGGGQSPFSMVRIRQLSINRSSGGASTSAEVMGLEITLPTASHADKTITRAAGTWYRDGGSPTGTVGTQVGIYIDPLTNGTSNIAISTQNDIDLRSAGTIVNIAGTGNNWTASGVTVMTSADSAAVADSVTFGRYEIGAGNTVIALSQETAVAADTDEAKFSHKMQCRINGATYFLMLTDS